jgi:hypothetical protein
LGSLAFINDIKDALINHFYYDDEIDLIYRSAFSNEEWTATLKDELDQGRPVIYRGTGTNGGHGWVCDGYDPDELFHMNWGWGGSFNGYFELSDLHPGGYAFNEGQMALINMTPLVTGVPEMAEYSLQLFPNPATDRINIRYRMPDAGYRMPDAGYRMPVADHSPPQMLQRAGRSQITRIELYSIDGRMILEEGLAGNELDISNIPSGLYVIRIQEEGQVHTGRFIKK